MSGINKTAVTYFKATVLKQSPIAARDDYIESSLVTTNLGAVTDFTTKFRAHLDGYKPLGADLIFTAINNNGPSCT
jgi:hypothetical protein